MCPWVAYIFTLLREVSFVAMKLWDILLIKVGFLAEKAFCHWCPLQGGPCHQQRLWTHASGVRWH